MDKHFFHPLGDNAPDYTAFKTYSGHGIGNLDYGVAAGTPVYAMCDGTISYCGQGTTIYSQTGEPNTYCVLKCSAENNNLGEAFYIRYLHGDYTVQTGDKIQKGQQIGTIASHGNSTGPHLHIDFTFATPPTSIPADYPRDPAVAGSLLQENNNYYFICNSKRYLINNNTHIEKVIEWRNINGSGLDVGYCWLVFAQNPQYLEPSPIPSKDKINIDRSVYDAHQGSSGHDNEEGVNAYFNAIFTEDFIGPPPNTWNDFLNNWNLRCLVSFVRHETGALIHSNRWLFASAITAKMMRATVLCHKGVNEVWGASYNTNNFQDWILTGAGGATDMGKYDGYGTTSDHRWRAWIGSQYINAGKYLVTEDPNGYNNILNKDDLPWITAVYNNFRYPDIYGASLEPNINSNFKQVLLDFCNGLVTDNYYLDGQYGYPVSDMAFKAEYHDGNMIFVGYRHKSDNSGITGSYNIYAYTLS